MNDKSSVLSLLNTFETYLNSLKILPSQKEKIFKSYHELKQILLKHPYEKKEILEFFSNFHSNHENNFENLHFSKPHNFIEKKTITFLIDIDKFPLYNSHKLKNIYNIQKIRSFNAESNLNSFYRCIGFLHLESLIKARNLEKLRKYSKLKLFSNKDSFFIEDLTNTFNHNILKLLTLLENPKNSEEFVISEFIAMINIFPSKFLDSIVLLIKHLLVKYLDNEKISHSIFLTPNEKNQKLARSHSSPTPDNEISFAVKEAASYAFDFNMTILYINSNQEPFQENITNNQPNAYKFDLIFFGKNDFIYVIGYSNSILKLSPQKNDHNYYSVPMKNDKIDEENVVVKPFDDEIHKGEYKESVALSATPKGKSKEETTENFSASAIPSERKNPFKLEYEQYNEPAKKNKLLHEKVKNIIFFYIK